MPYDGSFALTLSLHVSLSVLLKGVVLRRVPTEQSACPALREGSGRQCGFECCRRKYLTLHKYGTSSSLAGAVGRPSARKVSSCLPFVREACSITMIRTSHAHRR